jgi:hypothetical protein
MASSTWRNCGLSPACSAATPASTADARADSGQRRGHLRRPQRYNRRLRHMFYMSALTTLKTDGHNRD